MTHAATPPRLALCLSGGGFRATLYHLGVVRLLRQAGMLGSVKQITAVSGGSILAAHLVLNWERYAGEDEAEFERAAGEVEAFTRHDLRGHVMRSWLVGILSLSRFFWSGVWGRPGLLRAGYDRLLGQGKTLGDLAPAGKERPHLHILATCLTTGHLVSFDHKAMCFGANPNARAALPCPPSVPANKVPLSLAVAASSAFPVLFPPVGVDGTTFGLDRGVWPHDFRLADGGIFDNLAIRRMLWTFEDADSADRVLVCDANPSLMPEVGNRYRLIFSRALRGAYLMMDRLSDFENESVEALKQRGKQVVFCRLRDAVGEAVPGALAAGEQAVARALRTDLNRFTRDEGVAVQRCGYSGAAAALGRDDPAPSRWDGARPIHGGSGWDLWRWLVDLRAGTAWVLLALGATWALLAYAACAFPWMARAVVAEAAAAKQGKRADYEERQKDAAHVAVKLLLAQRLGALAASEGKAEWDLRREEWREIVFSPPADPWFRGYLEEREDTEEFREALRRIDAEGFSPERLAEVRKQVGGVSDNLGAWILGTAGDKADGTIYPLARRAKVGELPPLIERITRSDKDKYADVSVSLFAVRSLRYGELAMKPTSEGTAVAEKLAAFVELLDRWADSPDKTAAEALGGKLKAAGDQVVDACHAELAAGKRR